MLKVATAISHEPYREYKDVERVYSGSTEIDKILDKNGNVLFAVNKEVEGTPALTYKGKEETNLKNYRIYGQTVDGESVGDKTGNLFDGEFLQGCWTVADGSYLANYPTWICTDKLPCKPNTAYTLSFNSANSRWYGFLWFAENGDYILSDTAQSPQTQCHYTATSPSNAAYMAIDIAGYPDIQDRITPSDVTDFMLVEGSTALPYEPFGYKVPVTVSNDTDTLTTPIYLPEPIKMVGDEAEYIDYAEQKQHRVRVNLFDGIESAGTFGYNNVDYRHRGANMIPIQYNSTYTIKAYDNNINISVLLFSQEQKKAYDSGRPVPGSDAIYDFGWQNSAFSFTNVYQNASYMGFLIKNSNGTIITENTHNIMLNSGSEPLPYEPYIENTEVDVTLPALPTLPGTNTLTVGTEVQPSNVYLKGRIKEVS